MSNHDPRPSFAHLMERHQIAVEQVVVLVGQSVHYDRVGKIIYQGCGTAVEIDACLAALSELTGERYSRANVGHLSFLRCRADQEISLEGQVS